MVHYFKLSNSYPNVEVKWLRIEDQNKAMGLNIQSFALYNFEQKINSNLKRLIFFDYIKT